MTINNGDSNMDGEFTGAVPRYSGAISAVTGGPPEDINEMPALLNISETENGLVQRNKIKPEEKIMNAPIDHPVKPIRETLISPADKTSGKWHAIETKAELVASRAQVDFLKTSGRTRELIHRRPLTAVFAGLGVGCLIGGLTSFAVGKLGKSKKDCSSVIAG